MNQVLEARRLRKVYREFELRDICFTLSRGEILGIIGPNGAGKTTTIKLLMNMINADGGDVRIFDLPYDGNEKQIKNRIGYVGEEQNFYMNKTVRWTEKFVSRFFRNWDHNRFTSLLERFQLSNSKKIQELSRGMKVKLSLAIALSHDAELLIMDEPTSGLDPVVRREVLDLLQEVSEQGHQSTIFSSHITADIDRIADFIIFMVGGEIVLHSSKEQLRAHWKKIHYKNGSLTAREESALKNIRSQSFGGCGITDRYPQLEQALSDRLAGGDIRIEDADLDDILISFVKDGGK